MKTEARQGFGKSSQHVLIHNERMTFVGTLIVSVLLGRGVTSPMDPSDSTG